LISSKRRPASSVNSRRITTGDAPVKPPRTADVHQGMTAYGVTVPKAPQTNLERTK
jgi:hypothetical protein